MAGDFKAEYIFLKDNLVIMRHRKGQFLRISPQDHKKADGGGGAGAFAQWNVKLDGKKDGFPVIKLQSAKSGGYLRIYDQNGLKMDVGGGGGKWTRFKVHKTGANSAKLESVELPGKYPAVQPKGPAIGGGGAWTEFHFFRKGNKIGQAKRGNYNPHLHCKIGLLGAHGRYVRAAVNGSIHNDREHCLDHEIFESIPVGNGKVLLKTAHGKHLSARGHNTGFALEVSDNKVAWEQFEVIEHNGKYSFKSHHGRYIRAHHNKSVDAQAEKIGPWEGFQVSVIEQRYNPNVRCKVSLFSGAHGKYVRAAQNGTIHNDRDHCGNHEIFVSIPMNGKVLLKTAHGKFLSARPQDSGFKLAVSDNKAGWEQFEVIENNGKFSFKGAHGRYIRATGIGNQVVDVKAEHIKAWERFTVKIVQ